MSTARFVVCAAVALVTMSTAAASSRNGESRDRAVSAAVDALDRCVQDRFIRTDKGFGMSRIATAVHNVTRFIPADDSERNAVRELETRSVRLVMYLASRQKPRTNPLGLSTIPELLQGPILVNPAPVAVRTTNTITPLEDLPDEADLTVEAAASFAAFAESDSREFDLGRWQFVARPVRASAATCLGCHNPKSNVPTPFRPGDAIGAMLYGYQTPAQRP